MDEHDIILPLVTDEGTCLPLSVNIVARYWGVDIPMAEAVNAAKKYPGISGNIMIEGIELAEKHGLESRIIHSDLDELKKIIDAGIPVTVILPGIRDTIQHASVISGYDSDGRTVTHYIPKMEQDGAFHVGVIPEQRFDQNWSEDGRLMIILGPADVTGRLKSHTEEESNRLCFESERHSLLKNHQKSVELLTKALSLEPDNVTAHLLLGSALNEQNSPDCVEHYEKCITINKNSYLAYRGLGNYYLKAKQFALAEKYYTDAIDVNSERYGPVYKNRGIVRMYQNNNAGAKYDLEKYLHHVPDAADQANIRKAIADL